MMADKPAIVLHYLIVTDDWQSYVKSDELGRIRCLADALFDDFKEGVYDQHRQVLPDTLLYYQLKVYDQQKNRIFEKTCPTAALLLDRSRGLPLFVQLPEIGQSFDVTVHLSEELMRYREIGIKLMTDPIIQDVAYQLESLFHMRGDDVLPFVFLEQSSGQGKTQAAFALEQHFANRQDVQFLYLVCSAFADSANQAISVQFRNLSEEFIDCVTADVAQLNQLTSENQYTVFGLTKSSLKLRIYGLLYQLVVNPKRKNVNRLVKSCSEVVFELSNQNKHLVVVLDEFPEQVKGLYQNENYLRLMRNSMRAVNAAVVIMGTNSSASNMVVVGQASRGSDPTTWCYLYPRLPQVCTDVFDEFDLLPQSVQYIVSNSRPLFAVIGFKSAVDLGFKNKDDLTSEDFDSWFQKVEYEIRIKKDLAFKGEGYRGQLLMYYNSSYQFFDHTTEVRKIMIHRHFAQLQNVPKDSKTLYYELKSSLTTIMYNGRKFVDSFVFPEVQEDLLLYLCLMGGKNINPFMDYDLLTEQTFLSRVKDVIGASKSIALDSSNAMQTSNDGMYLEAVQTGVIGLASHMGGLGGITYESFICTVFKHIQLHTVCNYRLQYMRGSSTLKQHLQTSKLPFFAPPNQAWPEVLKQFAGLALGNFGRAQNKDQVDVSSDCHLYAESKDTKMTSSVVGKIILKIPADSQLHIGFIREFQDQYFKDTVQSLKDLIEQSGKNRHYCCFRVVAHENSKDSITFQTIEGLPHLFKSDFKKCCLVLFFQVASI